ncbi:replication initiator [Nonomuraea fuscirosea]|uniref:replication initiator n=1 Tax=Nonomuraea fuscirosea TaxID=1291556 RepID=UPI003433BAEA
MVGGYVEYGEVAVRRCPHAATAPRPAPRPQRGAGTPARGVRRRGALPLDALRYETCSATCPNWLRYGIQPKDSKPGMQPGRCRGKAHKPEHLGYAGRRVLVSRKWSNKTLAEHKQDRRTWVLEALGQTDKPTDPHRYIWRPVPVGDANVPPLAARLLRSVHERQRWRAHLRELAARAAGQNLSATEDMGRAA